MGARVELQEQCLRRFLLDYLLGSIAETSLARLYTATRRLPSLVRRASIAFDAASFAVCRTSSQWEPTYPKSYWKALVTAFPRP
jgi:hypothetical protein